MFRLAVISDVHADLHALLDALRQIDEMRCDAIVCCGDVVDYGLFPDETIAELVRRKIPTVRANHDRCALERRAGGRGLGTRGCVDGILARFADVTAI